tara:strand:- start:9673 stop:11415 length:1743 start_codon:yes stop_codon:yes gene_type:complete
MRKQPLLTILILLLSSCGSLKKLPQESNTQLNTYLDGPVGYKAQLQFKYLFLEAQRQKALEEFEKACATMEQCLSIDPFNADAHFEMANLYLKTNRLNEALFHAIRAENLNPNNVWAVKLLAQLYQVLGNIDGEVFCYKKLLLLDPHDVESLFQLAQAYTQNKNYKKAISSLNEIEKKSGLNEDLSIRKERLYILLGELDLAVLELKKLITAFPKEMRYRRMLAELYKANDLNIRAIKVYKEIIEIDSRNPYANMALAEYYRVNNDFDMALDHINVCFDSPEIKIESILQILSTYAELSFKEKKYGLTLEALLKKALSRHPNEAQLHLLSADLSYQKNMTSEAFISYEKALELGLTEFSIWNRYLMLGLELKKHASVGENGLKSIELYPIQPTLYLITGISFSFTKQYLKAIEIFQKGLNYVVNNSRLKADFYSYLGNSFHELGEHEKSDENYEKSLRLIPDNPLVLNNFSYYLSLRSTKLELAESYSKKSIELSPNEPNYFDTYGWILYKLERYSEAKIWLEKAVMLLPNSSVILEHYGDLLFKLNEKKEALSLWKKAQEKGGESKWLNQKVREGTLYE